MGAARRFIGAFALVAAAMPAAAWARITDAALMASGAPAGDAWLPIFCSLVVVSPLLGCIRRGQG